jgi:hypothetical protein
MEYLLMRHISRRNFRIKLKKNKNKILNVITVEENISGDIWRCKVQR